MFRSRKHKQETNPDTTETIEKIKSRQKQIERRVQRLEREVQVYVHAR